MTSIKGKMVKSCDCDIYCIFSSRRYQTFDKLLLSFEEKLRGRRTLYLRDLLLAETSCLLLRRVGSAPYVAIVSGGVKGSFDQIHCMDRDRSKD